MNLYPKDGTFDEFKSPEITAWKMARGAIEHENILVNHRLTWLSTSQAFLFSVFGLMFLASAKGELRGSAETVVPWVMTIVGLFALYICIVLQIALSRAFWALAKITT